MSKRNGKLESTTQADVIDGWDDYFQAVAEAVRLKSKDPKCQVGAVVVSIDRLIISTGFNGFARGVLDDVELLKDEKEKLNWICHAEANAIQNAARFGISLVGATIYTTKFPCLACCGAITQAGVKAIHTLDSSYWGDDPFDQASDQFKKHDRKRVFLRQAAVQVIAPNHPEYTYDHRHLRAI